MKPFILNSKRTGFMNSRVHLYLKGSWRSMAKSLHYGKLLTQPNLCLIKAEAKRSYLFPVLKLEMHFASFVFKKTF